MLSTARHRTSLLEASPGTLRSLQSLNARLAESLGPALHDLVMLRASQINGCAYCVDLHATSLSTHGIPARTIHGVAAWRHSPFFDDSQRVALAFTDALTGGIDPIDDDLWDQAGRLLGDGARADLIVAIGTINTLNMAGVTTHLTPAHHEDGHA